MYSIYCIYRKKLKYINIGHLFNRVQPFLAIFLHRYLSAWAGSWGQRGAGSHKWWSLER